MGVRFNAAILSVAIFMSGDMARADELTLEFNIQPQREGSSPWDSTGVHSGQIDTPSDNFGGIVERFLPTPGVGDLAQFGMQWGVDRTNDEIGAPDPYVCFLTSDQRDLRSCIYQNRDQRADNTLRYRMTVPEWVLRNSWFGVVLIDADLNRNMDDLIGYGVVLDERTLAAVRSGHVDARRVAGQALAIMKDAVQPIGELRDGLLRLQPTLNDAEPARLARSKCEEGCLIGNADVKIRITTDGW